VRRAKKHAGDVSAPVVRPDPAAVAAIGGWRRSGVGAGRFFRGLLGDVRIYRTALSVSDVQAVMKE
jgi:hypothetical protein